MIYLGSTGEQITVVLPTGCDFVVPLVASEPWPDGVVITLRLLGGAGAPVVWTAEVDGVRATFDVPAAEVDEVIGTKPTRSRLIYQPASGGPLLWAQGGVSVV